ncbi:MAG: secretion protein HlyD [Candidatus Rokuibacteriota bacterium]|nr:MAG: secretion protein HlyD [Candidatus Rokubacteria bacterium]
MRPGDFFADLRKFSEFTARGRYPRRRLLGFGAIALGVAAALGYAGYLYWYGQTHVSTDDAYITGHIAPVSARVAGPVIAVLVDDNQDVKAGAVLVRLDPKDYEVALAQARAAVETARGDLGNANATVPLTSETTASGLRQAEAALAAAQHGSRVAEHDLEERRSALASKQAAVAAADAAVRAAEADFERDRLDRERSAELYKRELVAKQDLDHADAAYNNARATLDVVREKLAQARADVQQAAAAVRSQEAAAAQAGQRVREAQAAAATARSQLRQVTLKESDVDASRGRLAQALANLEQAQLNLAYTTIRAPLDGRVTKKTVEVGQVVQPGQALLAIVDLDTLWVVANYKETELTNVRRGQRATVTVDTYPGVVFRARVDSVQAGSGAVFSLLPPENATGNFIKVVQRVPVKLVFEAGENSRHLLVPGMSVVPTIALR